MLPKTVRASATVEFKRSAIDRPLNWIDSVSLLYRFPRQTSHSTYTLGRKLISIFRRPSPWHASHLPPFTLKLNLPALYPRARDSGSIAYSSRIGVNTPVYVAGLDRGVRPIAD